MHRATPHHLGREHQIAPHDLRAKTPSVDWLSVDAHDGITTYRGVDRNTGAHVAALDLGLWRYDIHEEVTP